MDRKKSFVLYNDLFTTVEYLSDEQAGILMKMILQYANTGEVDAKDQLLMVAFDPIRRQMDRDRDRYDAFVEKQSANGRKGGRPKKPNPFLENPKNPTLFSESQRKPTKAKKAYTDTVTVTVTDTVTDTKEPPINSPQGEKQKQKRKSRIPENFQPADKNYALQYGIENPDLAVEIFCDWAIAGAKTYIDWNLTWKTACRTWLPEKVLQAQANQSRGKSLEEQNQHMKPVEPIEEPDGWRDTAAKFTARPDLQHKEWTKLAPREREVILEKMKV